MINVKRLGHATFGTPDLDRQIDYWTDVIGLSVIARTKDHCFLGTNLGEEAVAIERSSEAGTLRSLAFQVAPGSDLDELSSKLKALGIKPEHRSDISPGVKTAIRFHDPKGTPIDVYADGDFIAAGDVNAGVKVLKFGHVAYRVNDVQAMTSFYCDVLGFRVSDWIGDHFSFLRCRSDHHTINFVRYEEEALHHIAFELRDWSAMQSAVEHLTRKQVQLVWGPLRHVVGHNIASYHRNPDDIRVELYTELDRMTDEDLGYWEPRPWHEEFPLRPKVWPRDTLRSQWGFGSFGAFPGSS